ncbi:MAG TPA: glucosaminidase domain-containing protein [Chitinophagaceae bacterium]
MQNVKNILVAVFLSASLFSAAQQQEVILNYINTYKDIAIAEMERTGVPASIKLAQGIHETMAGTSDLVTRSNNHFGIKCKANWTGESVSHDDDLRGECFRKYDSPAESYRDHSDFLKKSQRYASLFKLDPLDYSAWAYGLKKAGYATNPKYPQVIIKLVEDYDLQNYTLIALGRKPATEEILAKTTEVKNEKEVIPAVAVTEPQENAVSTKPAKAIITTPLYPAGEFKLNDTRVVYAKGGMSFLSIAQQYNVPLARIFEFNDMKESETLLKDQLIYLQRKRKTGNNEFHIVKPGETLHGIAQEEGIRMESLLEYNQLQNNMKPAVGQQLYLRAKAPARPLLATGETMLNDDEIAFAKTNNAIVQEEAVLAPGRTMGQVIHTVQSKETVYSISKKYNVSMEDIAGWNQLSSYELKTGQQLKIYK